LTDRTARSEIVQFSGTRSKQRNNDIPVPDLATIHEAHQYLMKTYVEERTTDLLFLSIDQIMENQYQKRDQNEIKNKIKISKHQHTKDSKLAVISPKLQQKGSSRKHGNERRGAITKSTIEEQQGVVSEERRGSITDVSSAKLFARYTKVNKERRGSITNVNKERRGSITHVNKERRGSITKVNKERRGSITHVNKERRESITHVNKERRGSITNVLSAKLLTREYTKVNKEQKERRGSITKVNKERRGSITNVLSAKLFAREYTKVNKERRGSITKDRLTGKTSTRKKKKHSSHRKLTKVDSMDGNVISSFGQLQANDDDEIVLPIFIPNDSEHTWAPDFFQGPHTGGHTNLSTPFLKDNFFQKKKNQIFFSKK
jgi:hypothetical protein